MENVLILTEKKYIEKKIKEAIPNVKCISIGGHAYTSDEKDILRVPQEILDSSICVHYKDEEGVEESVHILSKEKVNENCQKILDFLKDNDVDTIINACDFDKNGDYLFKYVVEDIMKLDDTKYTFERMKMFDITNEGIVNAYNDIFNRIDNDLER